MTTQTPTAPGNATFVVWDLPLRLSHWLLVAAIAVAFLSSEEDSALAGWHMAAGWAAAVLIVFRLVWGVVGGEHALFASFVRPAHVFSHLKALASARAERTVGHNPAGGIAVLLLIAMIGAVIATGWQALHGGEENLHEAIAWFLLGLVGIHVAAVVATSLLSGENLVRAMVTGQKQSADHPSVLSVRRAGPLALFFSLLVAGAAVAGIRVLDPQAFKLQAREAAEWENGEKENGEVPESGEHGTNPEGDARGDRD
ncbi:Cytochrome b [Novosphingobium sp. CF614]|uniref:cytochrome b/b6 domain-containing protein n=1 Tax=Novosphingobium sp. CF614 TaxID=1884364 RepID=UPI0008E33382|nr:cytochrome b/b6 domain-containing protein [Novosphingobium sp. CF614]SFG53527.1 Cytochrome b [Novosphingobium sp. CF614]